MKIISNLLRLALAAAALSVFCGQVLASLRNVAPMSGPAPTPGVPLVNRASYLRLRPDGETSPVYGLVRMGVETDGVASNPFDPAQIDIEVHFTSPQQTRVTVPAFWFQDYDPVTLAPKGKPGWQVRFSPETAGVWTAQAELASAGLVSQPAQFRVSASPGAHGFVRIDPRNPRYLAFDDGSPYFPIGINLAWANDLDSTLANYQHWFNHLSQNGGNFARVWMASWGFGIEWNDTGLGNYTNRLRQAWLLDQVFQMASERGIYIMLTLLNHGAFSQTVNPEWSDNPYNAALGGPLNNPQDFVTDPEAKDLFMRRLRYIAARYAYSPNLMAWEWWNEVDHTPIRSYPLNQWITQMDGYLKSVDPYHHLTTNSYAGGILSSRLLPELSFTEQHDYSGDDPIRTFQSISAQMARLAPDSPLVMGEIGASASGEDPSMGSNPIQLHNGLWAAPFSGFASTGMYWWWDNYVDPLDLWGQLKGVSEFFKGEDLTLLKPGAAQVTPGKAQALTLQNPDQALVWIRNNAYEYSAGQKAYRQALKGAPTIGAWKYEPAMLSNLSITLNGLSDGTYQAAWFNPGQARWLADTRVTVRGSKVRLAVPDFSCDLAVKLEKKK